ncbi:M4 family metallopeptidase [Aureibaculum sp. 2210JD6-5]|uniref:M4 family metallopeptidase n=1 Tax=Aureibaculum sp. 2210JD6-5 TaxID=3103957 RepID=UPI002AADECF4|nr:M4 family metallopeptidase [Aureibaculum sp. 2210JD6-5]MDY7394821.1 M4 family metallopeptidase [Aureibaculum sp. 2210JD6-5]
MCNKAYCTIIPPHILEELAKRGNTSCKKTLNDTHRILQKRNTVLNNLLIQEEDEENGGRYIYDSQNQYKQRVELVRKENDPEVDDVIVNEVYDMSGFVRDYFKTTFDLNSIDNKGMDVISNIRYGKEYNNAFWDGDEMTYGEGDGIQFKDFTKAIDVIAHELMHGVTQFLANLEYQSQSGALNEHFSDVFGTIIKQKFLKQDCSSADWLIGDLIVTDKFPGKAIRSMKAPGTANDFDTQPDHMDNYYAGSADNQGVHINSGIPNKAFYLTAIEIGIDNCSIIWFETLKTLWRTANFNDMLDNLLVTTNTLVDQDKINSNAVEVVTNSFTEVGLTQIAKDVL